MGRKLKIALSSSLVELAALADITVDNQVVDSNLSVAETISNPLVKEYMLDSNDNHSLKITLLNDYSDNGQDLNLIINYIALSNEDGSYDAYTYLKPAGEENLRTADNSSLLSGTIYESGKSFELDFTISSPTTWVDIYQYDIDNPPPPPEEPVV